MSILTELAGLTGFRALARQLVGTAIGAVLPQDCHLCGSASGDSLLCTACTAELPRLPQALCPRCALPSPTGEVCGRCQKHPPHFDRMIAAFPYAFPIDRLVQQLKYGHQLALATWLGEQLAEQCRAVTADLVVPLPLHAERIAERGFNQAAEIARALARELKLTLAPSACRRARATAPQEGLNLLQRRRNLNNAFLCPVSLEGKRVMLVDDVATTGASVDECARTLKLHGAKEVTVAVVARTLLD